MINQFAEFTDEVSFIIILIILLVVAIIVGITFDVKSITPILLIFAMVMVYLYMSDVLSIDYAAIGYIIFALIVYVSARNNKGVDQ